MVYIIAGVIPASFSYVRSYRTHMTKGRFVILVEGELYKFWYEGIREVFPIRDDEEFLVFVPHRVDEVINSGGKKIPGDFYHSDGTEIFVSDSNAYALSEEIVGRIDRDEFWTTEVGRKTKMVEYKYDKIRRKTMQY